MNDCLAKHLLVTVCVSLRFSRIACVSLGAACKALFYFRYCWIRHLSAYTALGAGVVSFGDPCAVPKFKQSHSAYARGRHGRGSFHRLSSIENLEEKVRARSTVLQHYLNGQTA